MKTYAVKECFRTIQGEGSHAGTPAIFLRLAGCNMWSGDAAHRERDAVKNDAECPRWCDTDFVGGAKLSADQVVELVESRQGVMRVPLIVISGGEPLLQVDDELLDALAQVNTQFARRTQVAIETNGTVAPKFDADRARSIHGLDPEVWITLSPKQGRARLALSPSTVSELKLVWPAYDPTEWADWPSPKFIQPQALYTGRWFEHEKGAAAFVIKDGSWRLSLQTHKVVQIP